MNCTKISSSLLVKNRYYALLFSLIFGLSSFSVFANDNNLRLQEIRSNISSLKQSIGSDRKRQQTLQTELRKTEIKIAELSRQQRSTVKKLKQQKQTQKKLLKEQKKLQEKHALQQGQLRQQVRAGYSAGQQQTLKLLLNQNDPAELSRTMTYYAYYTEAQSTAIKLTQKNISELNKTEKKLSQSTQRLQKLKQEQGRQQKSLTKNQTTRKTVLTNLNAGINSKEQRLIQLKEDEQALSQLIEDIRHRSTTKTQQSNLAQLKNKLKWPTNGAQKNHFGKTRNQVGMKWQGITISGKEGQDIHSIAAGKVVYADWIRGYGLMLIIDHGHQYMSIYSHNQSLYKDVGDQIKANETIASLGNSGGKSDYALYFEIRYKGKPVNPSQWCR